MDLNALQRRASIWHRRRFPEARMEHITLKMCEEAGEVASAVNGVVGANSATGGGDVLAETADVIITLLVLHGRWFPDSDIAAAIDAKLSVLEDPNSGHRAAALA